MKGRIAAILRALVSVSVLAYVFQGIFRKEVGKRFAEGGLDLDALGWAERTRLLWTEGPRALGGIVRQVDPGWFAAGIFCFGVVCFLCVLRWQLLLRVQGLALPLLRTGSIFFVGLFFNAFLLGSTGGDVMRAWLVAHETHHKKAEAVVTVAVDRVVGLLALFLLALGVMLAFHDRVLADRRLGLFALVTVAVVAGAAILIGIGTRPRFAGGLPEPLRFLRRLPKYDAIRRMVEAFRLYARSPGVIARAVLWSVAVQIFVILSIVCIGFGLRLTSENGVVDYLLYLPIINTLAALPITVAGFGVRELMYVEFFREVGIAESAAVALSILGYFATLFWSLVGGLFFLTYRKELPPAERIGAEE